MDFDYQPTLVGKRVIARPLREEDFAPLYAVAADPELWEQHSEHNRWREEVFQKFFRAGMASGSALCVLDSRSNEVIGTSRYHGCDGVEVEIGWTFLGREFWGGSYNGELKRLMIDHAFRFVERVIFMIGPKNIRSQRAVEKIGGKRIENRIDSRGDESFVYAVNRSSVLTSKPVS